MTAFQLLHTTVQRKLWDMKWTELRPIQEDAIAHLLGGAPTDCIISSPTASGKTEAAFLPVLSAIADDPAGGIRAMYVGPLKALIDDQFGRLEELCARMEMPVHRWHGDVGDGARRAVLAAPSGVLLITPESLEAMFVLRAARLPALFGRLAYVVIDETHAFLGTQRGAQLISQLHRLRVSTGADPIRIGLSATLGDPDAARRWLRRDGRPVRMIEAPAQRPELRLRVHGAWRRPPAAETETQTEPGAGGDPALREVAARILRACRGKTSLVFANAKSMIEALADELGRQAKAAALADEIVVHHGSLAKEEREHAEARLRSGRPCLAVCSNTLELGIDIGAIDEVVQVSAPWSVASLVQRVGRTGRRPGTARTLRAYLIEDAPEPDATVWDRIHLPFLRGVASVELLLEGWLEAPDVERASLSTLVQQILSILAETGGIRAADLFPRLAGSGAFPGLGAADLAQLLRALGARDLIEQLPDGSLVLGLAGQRTVEHHGFYAAFPSPVEYQVLHGGRAIGTLPESLLPALGEHLLLGGRRWLVEQIDVERREVHVAPGSGQRPPRFASGQPDVAPEVHARMRALLLGDAVPAYLGEAAVEILAAARRAAREAELGAPVHADAGRAVLQLWAGTRIQRTLWLALAAAGLRVAAASDVALEVHAAPDAWRAALRRFAAAPDADALAALAEERLRARVVGGEKYDALLPAELWRQSYARERLDLDGAARRARELAAVAPAPGRREP